MSYLRNSLEIVDFLIYENQINFWRYRMFEIIKANVTPQQAKAMYPDNWVVLIVKKAENNEEEDVFGDIVFVGNEDEISPFTRGKNPQAGHMFYRLRGNNLRELTAIEVVA
jgi:hypothetical protein